MKRIGLAFLLFSVSLSAQIVGPYRKIFFSGGSQVATPALSPSAGTYTTTQTVSITDATGGALVCYTTDGSVPVGSYVGCTNGTQYTGTFTVSSTTTVNAQAYAVGLTASIIASSNYFFSASSTCGQTTETATAGTGGLYPQASTCTTGSNPGGYSITSGAVYIGSNTTGTWGLAAYSTSSNKPATLLCNSTGGSGYTANSFNTLSLSSACSGTILAPSTQIWPAYLGTGNTAYGYVSADCITGTGGYYGGLQGSLAFPSPWTGGGSDGALCPAVYLTLATYPQAPPVVDSPGAGSYTGAQSVTLVDGAPSAAIYYTTDGSTPVCSGTTHGTLYSSPISLNTTAVTTIKSAACATGYTASTVASSTYNVVITGPTGSPSLIHASLIPISNGASSGSVTWPQPMAAGNWDLFACVIPNSAGTPVTTISSVNAGGTLLPLVGASTGSNGTGSQNTFEQSVMQILPSSSTGTSATTVTITLNQGATAAGSCYAAEVAPGVNASPYWTTDIDGSYQPTAAGSNLSNINVTSSSTNPFSFKMFFPSTGAIVPTAVNSPYNTNFAAGTTAAFSVAAGCGTGEQWTNASATPIMATVCAGFNSITPLEASAIDWAGVTPGSQVTAAQFGASIHGWQGGTPSFAGTIDGSSISVPFQTTPQRLAGDGGTYTGASSQSIEETGTGAAQNGLVKYGVAWGLPAPTGVSSWFCSTRSQNDGNAQDILGNAAGGGTNFQSNGALYFQLEGLTESTGTVPYSTDGSASCAWPTHAKNWVNIQIIGPVAGEAYMAVYQCSVNANHCLPLQVGSILSATSAAAGTTQYFFWGHPGSQTVASGAHNYWSSSYIFLNPSLTESSFPLPY